MTEHSKVIVFLGPSLSLAEARKILPDASYLPPIRCGDMLRALRLKPTLIAIIDGYFEHTAAVWHKEILYAIEKGVVVAGSSSMGALRAAELAKYGMVGVGSIFDDYHCRKLIDDDEVTVVHQPAQYHFISLTDAMVNIRATIQHAIQREIIDQTEGNLIIKNAKLFPYRERTLVKAIETANLNKDKANRLKLWLSEGNYADLKKDDATQLLNKIADESIYQYTPNISSLSPVPPSAFFRALHRNVMCRPFSSYQSWLPKEEKVALMARYFGQNYKLLRRLAYLLAAVYSCVHKHKIKPSSRQIETTLNNPIFQIKSEESQLQEYGYSQQEKDAFIYRMSSIRALLEFKLEKPKGGKELRDYLPLFVKLYGNYSEYKNLLQANNSLEGYILFEKLAKLWWIVESEIKDSSLTIEKNYLQEYSDQFRHKRHLFTQKEMAQWLAEHDLNPSGYHELMATAANFSFLVLQNNLDALNIQPVQTDIWWLRDALWLTGIYQDAKELLADKHQLEDIKLKQMFTINEKDLDQYAYSLDFIEGKVGFTNSPEFSA